MVSRYSGVDGVAPLGPIVSENTNGAQGACSGGSDGTQYAVNLSTTRPGSVVYGAIAMRSLLHAPGSGYAERDEVHHGGAGEEVSVATMDQTFESVGSVVVDGSFNGSVDWAVVGMEIRPGPPGTTTVPFGSAGLLLRPARPNPFRESTAIEYGLPTSMSVELVIYDVTGREIRRFARGYEPPGSRTVRWDGRNARGSLVGSGVYFAKLHTSRGIRIQKLVLTR
jgi:hypothetical protein